MKTILGIATVAFLATAPLAHAGDTATYSVTFNATWTKQSHPLDYPSDAHFSGLIGATHNGNYKLFVDGGTATKGLEALSEMGAHSPLDKEIDSAIAAGDAGVRFESEPLFRFPGKISATFTIDDKHPNVSVVAMVAPSPDWFTGVANIALKKDGKWRNKVTLPLYAWDAGTDGGLTYKADDADSQPRQSVRLNASAHFMGRDGVRPVGTVTFQRMTKATN